VSNLVDHAKRELALIGEDQDVVDWMVSVVAKYAEYGHSGGSHSICLPRLTQLLNFEPLAPLTDDPAEWVDRSEISGTPLWQSVRDGRAMSTDGGKTYTLVNDNESEVHTSAAETGRSR
jgi:hypothetical protein